ncbi:MAG: enoyl-CoA hydratase/isomerase family protein [Actinomycetia bacterium]|nr:enoyl-CoA hydratase/isomerase family protein [Actinomycetes bacterium]
MLDRRDLTEPTLRWGWDSQIALVRHTGQDDWNNSIVTRTPVRFNDTRQKNGIFPVKSDHYDLIKLVQSNGVLIATIDAPPMNVMTIALLQELVSLSQEIENDDSVRVLLMRSADPDFFIAHFDVTTLLAMPIDPDPEPSAELGWFHAMCERFRTGSTITIAEIDGRVGGGGAELSASFDMRFGATEAFMLNQMEVPLGILPGGSGTQRLPWLVGPGRAAEIVLGGIDVDACTADAWGWLNRALPAAELPTFVENLARRIASMPPTALALAKQSLLNATPDPVPGLLAEAELFAQTLRTPVAQNRLAKFLELGGQTREFELGIEAVASLFDS